MTEFDLNHDGKIDFSETTVDKILVNRKEDLDADGSFDRQTSFDPDASEMFFRVVEEKKTAESPRSRNVFWVELGQKRIFTLTQIDDNNDGSWDQEIQESTDLYQKKENCEVEDEISKLSKTSLKAANLSDEFESAPWGHQIHKSCLEAGSRNWFLENTKKAMEEGLACLSRLAGSGGKGAAKNHASLTNLLKQKNVQIICHDEKYDWSDTLAHATTSKADTGSLLKHPGISVNPKYKKEFKRKGKGGALDFKKTIFHEQMHNLGYLHGVDVEYPYACERCCFPSAKDSKELVDAACRVCSGNYKGSSDISYVKDSTTFGLESGRPRESLEATVRYLKRHKGDLDGSIYLALNLSDIFNPIGGQLAEKLRQESVLTKAQTELISRAAEFNKDELSKSYKQSSKIIADAFYASYVSHDPGLAVEILKKNSLLIKEQLASKNKDSASEYVVENLRESLAKILDDVLMNQFYGSTKDKPSRDKITAAAYEAEDLLRSNVP